MVQGAGAGRGVHMCPGDAGTSFSRSPVRTLLARLVLGWATPGLVRTSGEKGAACHNTATHQPAHSRHAGISLSRRAISARRRAISVDRRTISVIDG